MIQRPGAPLCSLTQTETRGSPDHEAPVLLERTAGPQRSCLAGCIRSAFVAEAESTGLDSYPEST